MPIRRRCKVLVEARRSGCLASIAELQKVAELVASRDLATIQTHLRKRIEELEGLRGTYDVYNAMKKKGSKAPPTLQIKDFIKLRQIDLIIFDKYKECSDVNEIENYLDKTGYRQENGSKFDCTSIKAILENNPKLVPLEYHDRVSEIEKLYTGSQPATIGNHNLIEAAPSADLKKRTYYATIIAIQYSYTVTILELKDFLKRIDFFINDSSNINNGFLVHLRLALSSKIVLRISELEELRANYDIYFDSIHSKHLPLREGDLAIFKMYNECGDIHQIVNHFQINYPKGWTEPVTTQTVIEMLINRPTIVSYKDHRLIDTTDRLLKYNIEHPGTARKSKRQKEKLLFGYKKIKTGSKLQKTSK